MLALHEQLIPSVHPHCITEVIIVMIAQLMALVGWPSTKHLFQMFFCPPWLFFVLCPYSVLIWAAQMLYRMASVET